MKVHIAHSGAWGIALIAIVVASWLLYRYLAPKTWEDWAGAGVIQAFIIALYAEMFGNEYREYRKRVPMFIPLWGQWGAMTSTRDETPNVNESE